MPDSAPIRMAAIGLNHPHIYGMVGELRREGAVLAGAHAAEPELRHSFQQIHPDAAMADDPDALYEDESIDLILTAAIPSERAAVAIRAMEHGKDVFSDKAGMTTLEQWRRVKAVQEATGQIYAVSYSERFGSRATVRALELVEAGAIGDVVHTIGLGPHSLRRETRPAWFFRQRTSGGILCDIASHQFDQYLAFTRETDVRIVQAQVANRANPDAPEFEDFGDVVLRGARCSGYIRVDWFTPTGLSSWGDTRLTVVGTHGFMDVRKNVDLAGRPGGDHLFIVDAEGTRYEDCTQVQLPFGQRFLQDIRDRTETAMPQAHCFEAMRLALTAQEEAENITASPRA